MIKKLHKLMFKNIVGNLVLLQLHLFSGLAIASETSSTLGLIALGLWFGSFALWSVGKVNEWN